MKFIVESHLRVNAKFMKGVGLHDWNKKNEWNHTYLAWTKEFEVILTFLESILETLASILELLAREELSRPWFQKLKY